MRKKKPKLTIGPAAKVLGNCTSYVRLLADIGQLPSERTVTGVRLFELDALEAFAAERAKKREAEAAK